MIFDQNTLYQSQPIFDTMLKTYKVMINHKEQFRQNGFITNQPNQPPLYGWFIQEFLQYKKREFEYKIYLTTKQYDCV